MNQPKVWRRYGITAQALHWIVAARKLALLAEHKSFGMTVFMLAVIRLVWRLQNPAPPLPTALKHHFWNQDDVLVRMPPNFRSENKSS